MTSREYKSIPISGEPDAQIGYSILVYRLSEANLQQALEGTVAEQRLKL